MGQLKRAAPTILLADADVLIDYRDSDLEVLKPIGQHVDGVAVLPSVLDEVHEVSRTDCERLSISVVEVATNRLLRTRVVDSSVSFNDRLCFVVCDAESWTCVTNDSALRRLCKRHGVQTRFGLRFVVDLVTAGAITAERAMSIACKMHESNPLHINERVIARFKKALDGVLMLAAEAIQSGDQLCEEAIGPQRRETPLKLVGVAAGDTGANNACSVRRPATDISCIHLGSEPQCDGPLYSH